MKQVKIEQTDNILTKATIGVKDFIQSVGTALDDELGHYMERPVDQRTQKRIFDSMTPDSFGDPDIQRMIKSMGPEQTGLWLQKQQELKQRREG